MPATFPTVDDLLRAAAARGDAGAVATMARRKADAEEAAKEAVAATIEAALAPVVTVLNRLGGELETIVGVLRASGIAAPPPATATPPPPTTPPAPPGDDDLTVLGEVGDDGISLVEEDRSAPDPGVDADILGLGEEAEDDDVSLVGLPTLPPVPQAPPPPPGDNE